MEHSLCPPELPETTESGDFGTQPQGARNAHRKGRGDWLLHLDGCGCRIEGHIPREGQRRFVPLRGEDLKDVCSVLTRTPSSLGAIEKLSRHGRRTNRLTPVLGLRLGPDGSVIFRRMVAVGR